jgi:hypothetical protein
LDNKVLLVNGGLLFWRGKELEKPRWFMDAFSGLWRVWWKVFKASPNNLYVRSFTVPSIEQSLPFLGSSRFSQVDGAW